MGTMMRSRRAFLKNGAMALVGTAAIPSFLTRAVMAQATAASANREKLVKAYAIRRLGLPSDVAPLVTLLASDAGSWITGQVISVNGGYSMV